MKPRKTPLEKNDLKRYRLPRHTAILLGCEPNKSGRYRLTSEQEKELFNKINDIRKIFAFKESKENYENHLKLLSETS